MKGKKVKVIKDQQFVLQLPNGEMVEVFVQLNSVLLVARNQGRVSFCPSMKTARTSNVDIASIMVDDMSEVVNSNGESATFN
jgi:hypothetical protein